MFAHSRSAESAIADCLPPHYLVPVLKTVVFAESLLTWWCWFLNDFCGAHCTCCSSLLNGWFLIRVRLNDASLNFSASLLTSWRMIFTATATIRRRCHRFSATFRLHFFSALGTTSPNTFNNRSNNSVFWCSWIIFIQDVWIVVNRETILKSRFELLHNCLKKKKIIILNLNIWDEILP